MTYLEILRYARMGVRSAQDNLEALRKEAVEDRNLSLWEWLGDEINDLNIKLDELDKLEALEQS